MNRLTRIFLAAGLSAAALAAAPAPAVADAPIVRGEDAAAAAFAADRETILAMAGDFKVTFDMQESTAWMEGYEPLERKVSGGYESVRVIEDTGTKIVLQHLLVTGDDANPYIVKHWRQDWEYEPEKILTYAGGDSWEWSAVPEKMRTGRWSQTVYQVDDSPRYAGWGQWETTLGVKRWRSNWTARPLARRDAIRNPVYDHYMGINRHQLTPTGWIHWQDNTKMIAPKGGAGRTEGAAPTPVVQEYVLNTYERFDGYNVAAAEAYWDKTRTFWDAVRGKWDAVAEANGGVRIEQEAGAGTAIANELLILADKIKAGKETPEAASEKAIAMIAEGTARGGG
ncbi:DUF6607 family protein [Erythrobacter sp.]|uniref:DUF6607 family protein n=1 Tax=Erythrobacter sp. TaxID=1042 RepID=UPI0025CC4AAC|nr:DUF6607 family protein [Erythrobacter sp.]